MTKTKLNITVEELAIFLGLRQDDPTGVLKAARRMLAADALYEAAADLLKHRIHVVPSEVIHKSYFVPLEQALALADGKAGSTNAATSLSVAGPATNEKAKFTSGSWKPVELRSGWDGLGHGDYRLYDAEGLPICTVDGGDGPENLANARLIAAAPDLLEAAKAALEELARLHNKGVLVSLTAIAKIEGAIAKAETEGGAQ